MDDAIQDLLLKIVPGSSVGERQDIISAIQAAGYEGQAEDLNYITVEDVASTVLKKTQARRLIDGLKTLAGW